MLFHSVKTVSLWSLACIKCRHQCFTIHAYFQISMKCWYLNNVKVNQWILVGETLLCLMFVTTFLNDWIITVMNYDFSLRNFSFLDVLFPFSISSIYPNWLAITIFWNNDQCYFNWFLAKCLVFQPCFFVLFFLHRVSLLQTVCFMFFSWAKAKPTILLEECELWKEQFARNGIEMDLLTLKSKMSSVELNNIS